MSIGKVLKEFRKAFGYTQVEMSSLLGVKRTTYTNWELDTSKPRQVIIDKILELYNTHVTNQITGILENKAQLESRANLVKGRMN